MKIPLIGIDLSVHRCVRLACRLGALGVLLLGGRAAFAQSLATATLATGFNNPYGVAVDSSGNAYVADTSNHIIRKVTPAGTVSLLAGASGTSAYTDNADPTLARFSFPRGIAINTAGTILYVADTGNHAIRVITLASAGGAVTNVATLAGTGSSGFTNSGATSTFNGPRGVALNSAGDTVYVADTFNHAIRSIVISGTTVSTVAGLGPSNAGFVNGNSATATFNQPWGIVVNAAGTALFVADLANHAIRRVDLSPVAVSTYAGTGSVGSANNTTGTSATFSNPSGLAIDGSDNVYVGDFGNNAIRLISATSPNAVTTPAGGSAGSTNGTGSGAQFLGPTGLAARTISGTFIVYVADTNNQAIRTAAAPAVATVGSPSNQTAAVGANGVTFTATVTGGWPAATLQWQRNPGGTGTFANLSNDSNYSGVTTGTLTVNGVTVGMNGDTFRLVATNSSGSAISATPASLTVTQPATAPTFATSTVTFTASVGQAASFANAVASGSTPITYSVTSGSAGIFAVNSSTGQITSTSNPTSSADSVVFTVTASNGTLPNATRQVTINVVVSGPPSITAQPQPLTLTSGQTSASFSVTATATPAITGYQWQRQLNGSGGFSDITDGSSSGVTFSGATTANLSITNVGPTMNGDVFRVVVTNGASSSTTSNGAALTVPPTITSTSNISFVVGQSNSFQFNASGTPSPAVAIVGTPTLPSGVQFIGGTGSATLTGSTNDTGTFPFQITATNSGGTVTQSVNLTVTQAQTPVITSAASTTFQLNQASTFTFTASGVPTPSISLSGALPAGLSYNPPILSGTPTTADNSPYSLTVTASSSSGTAQQTFVLTIQGTAPSITANPQATTVNTGQNATFTSTASGAPTPTLRWQRQPIGTTGFIDLTDNGTYSGTTSTTLTVTSVTAGMNGDVFRLVATNNAGTVSSSAAILNVNLGTTITTVAGLGTFTGFTDGTGSAARFNGPTSIVVDVFGIFYIADSGNQTIRKMTSNGVVTTLAGLAGSSGSTDGVGNAARFNAPTGLAVDASGNVYVADRFSHTIRVISPIGSVSTIAGTAGASGAADAAAGGAITTARFFQPSGVAVDLSGNIYVADTLNHAIRKIFVATGAVSTFAGTLGVAGYVNDTGTNARFNTPTDLVIDSSGNLYVADSQNNAIRKITSGGVVSTLAGSLTGTGGTTDANGTAAMFNHPWGLGLDSSGNVFVADTDSSTIRKIATNGDVTTIAGLAGSTGTADGVGGSVRFSRPRSVAIDSNGNLYIADTGNQTIRRSGTTTAVTITTQPANRGVAIGQTASFSVVATGVPSPSSYQWQRQPSGSFGFTNLPADAIYTGVNTSTLTITSVTPAMAGDQFRVIVANGVNPPATSDAGTLSVGTPPNFTSAATASFRALEAGTFTVTTDSSTSVTYTVGSGFPSWAALNSTTGVISGTPPDTTGSPFSFTITANNGVTATQTFTLTVLPANIPPTISTQPSGLAVNQGDSPTLSVVATGTPTLAYQWRRNGIAIAGATNSTLTLGNIQAASAGDYTVVITNPVSTVTSAIANVVVNTVPVITAQPHAQLAVTGNTVTFSVAASGGVNFTYSWRKNGVAIAGANASSLTLFNVGASDAGNYDVVVANGVGTVVSSLATLTLATGNTAPVITSQPASKTALVGRSVTLSVAATAVPAPGFQWRKNSVAIAGATNPTLTFSSAQSGDAGNYDVVISNGVGSVTSSTVGLRVIARSYAGYYFGSFGGGAGSFAIFVRDDNTGIFLGYLPGSTAPVMTLKFSVSDTGQFVFDQGAILAASQNPDEPARAAALNNVAVSGSIANDGAITGTLSGGANASLSGARAADTGSTAASAGFFQAGASSGGAIAYTIVGPNGQAFVVEQSGNVSDGGLGSVTAAGQVSVVTTRSVISEIVNAPAGTITGSSTGPINATLSGASEVVLGRQRLLNISSRARVATGDSVAIAGFVISGEDSKPVLIRAVGPTLGAAPFNVAGALASPRLELFRGSTSIAVNTGIGTNRAAVDAAGVQAGAFALGAAGTDAAILTTLPPGNYTAIVSSTTNTAGVALVEVYDLGGVAAGQKLLNIATRAAVGTGDNLLIAGFVVPPGPSKRVLVRGIGPGLAQFNITGGLAQPVLTLLSGSSAIATNTNWSTSADAATLTSASVQVGAFPLSTNDSALIVTLPAGNYTATVTGVGGATGVGLIEVYEVP